MQTECLKLHLEGVPNETPPSLAIRCAPERMQGGRVPRGEVVLLKRSSRGYKIKGTYRDMLVHFSRKGAKEPKY